MNLADYLVLLAVVLSATLTAPVAGQQTIGVGVDYMGFTFAEGLGASAAQLLMVPVAVRFPVSALTFDVYASWAQGPDRAADAHYVVRHSGGEAHFRVDQRRHGQTWVFLGRFHFEAGAPPERAAVAVANDATTGTMRSWAALAPRPSAKVNPM